MLSPQHNVKEKSILLLAANKNDRDSLFSQIPYDVVRVIVLIMSAGWRWDVNHPFSTPTFRVSSDQLEATTTTSMTLMMVTPLPKINDSIKIRIDSANNWIRLGVCHLDTLKGSTMDRKSKPLFEEQGPWYSSSLLLFHSTNDNDVTFFCPSADTTHMYGKPRDDTLPAVRFGKNDTVILT